jgi:hypothetical protein
MNASYTLIVGTPALTVGVFTLAFGRPPPKGRPISCRIETIIGSRTIHGKAALA